jgi:phosphoribosyl-ATP pyrophosphohydrolase/phosphoribosyl-AMP cyclohydrolase
MVFITLLLLLLLLQGVPMEDVMRVLRKRFGTSGIAEKAARPPKQ